MIEEGLIALIKANADLAALGQRVFADTLPDACTYPAMTYMIVGGRSDPTFSTPGLQMERFQFDFAGKTRRDVVTARAALIALLDGRSGALPNGEWLVDADYLQPLSLPYDSDKKVYWCGCEFYIRFNRT